MKNFTLSLCLALLAVVYAEAQQVQITDPGNMYSTYKLADDENVWSTIRNTVSSYELEKIRKYSTEDAWPAGIANYSLRSSKAADMKRYVTYKVAEFDGKYLLIIPTGENKHMPYDMQPNEHDIYFVIGKTGASVYTTPASSSRPHARPLPNSNTQVSSSAKGIRAKIKDSFGIWTDFNLRTNANASTVRSQLGSSLFEEVANNCNEALNWPNGISSYEERSKVRPQILNYVCYKIGEVDDKYILRVPVSENSFQPYNMRPAHDIFFIVRKTDVELDEKIFINNTGSNSYTSIAGEIPATIKSTGGLYSGFKMEENAAAASLRSQLGSSRFDEIAKYSKEENWPEGISTFSNRESNRSQMNDYKAYKVANVDDKFILHIPAAENKFMPYALQPQHDIYFVINATDVLLSNTESPKKIISEKATAYNTNAASSKNITQPVTFEGQLNALLEDYPNNFENMKGDKKPEDKDDVFKIDEWFSKVKLEGSKETVIRHDWLGTKNTMQASYGEFDLKSQAMEKFNALVIKIDASKTNCCTLVKTETNLENIIATSYLPFDLSGKMGERYDHIVLDVNAKKSFRLDENYKTHDTWLISVSIYKQK